MKNVREKETNSGHTGVKEGLNSCNYEALIASFFRDRVKNS